MDSFMVTQILFLNEKTTSLRAYLDVVELLKVEINFMFRKKLNKVPKK